jgi:hypothetical protein
MCTVPSLADKTENQLKEKIANMQTRNFGQLRYLNLNNTEILQVLTPSDKERLILTISYLCDLTKKRMDRPAHAAM